MDIKQVMAGKPDPENPEAQNLIGPSRVDSGILLKRPRGFYQVLILGIVGVVLAFCVGLAYESYLAEGVSLWFMIIAALFLFASSILQVFLVKKLSERATLIGLEAIALCVTFLLVVHWQVFLIGAAIVFFFSFWGHAESRSEVDYGTEIRFFKVTHPVAAKTMTALLLFAVVFFVMVRGVNGNFFVSESSFDVLFRGGAAVFGDFYPQVLVDGSFQNFSQSIAQEQLSTNPTFMALPPADQATAMDAATANLTANFSRALDVTIEPSSTTSGVIYDFIVTALRNWHDRFGIWFVIGWAFVLFIVLRSFGVLFILIAQFFGMIFYEILLATAVIQVVEHPQTKEEVEFV